MAEQVHPRVSLGQEPQDPTSIGQPELPGEDLAELDLHPGKLALGELRDLIGGAGVELPSVDLP
jgi:hypothetical protein